MTKYCAGIIYGYTEGDCKTWDEMQVEIEIASIGDPASSLGDMVPEEYVQCEEQAWEEAMEFLKNVENLAFVHLEKVELITQELTHEQSDTDTTSTPSD